MFEFAVKDIVIIVLAGISAAGIVGWLFRKDTAIEHRRRDMIDLAARLKELGLERLAGFATSYAIGDYSGLWVEGKILAKQLMDTDEAMELLAKSFFTQLPKRLAMDGDREKILRVVDDFRLLVEEAKK